MMRDRSAGTKVNLETETRIAFRVDGGFTQGMGHLARSLTLAAELERRGALIDFVTRPLPARMAERIAQRGYRHRLLRDGNTDDSNTGILWADSDQERDARQTILALPAETDLVVVDHYGLGATWERLVGEHIDRVVVIGDLADRPHSCDVLVDQGWFGPETSRRYDEHVSDDCLLLLGPRYALLEPEYARLRERSEPRTPAIRRVVVSFGGSDPTGETRKVLQAVEGAVLGDVPIDVVLGAGSVDTAEELRAVTNRGRVSYHVDLPTLADVLSQARFAVGAGGITTWERICLGVPSLVTSVAPNQAPAAAALQEAGVIRWMGNASDTTSERYRSSIRAALVDDLPQPPPIVDGQGARRVALALLGPPSAPLHARSATELDAPVFLGADRASPSDEPPYLSGPPIWNEQIARLRSDIEGGSNLPLVLVLDGTTVGAARVSRGQGRNRVSYWLDDAVSGLGLEGEVTALVRDASANAAGPPTRSRPSSAESPEPHRE